MKKTLCLNMIVKNESKIIVQLLKSVKDYIDYYVIVDTGSTDDTVSLISNLLGASNITGEIYHEKWRNFGYNRNHALKLAKNKCDYTLLIDCDMQLIVEDKDFKDKLVDDMYMVNQYSGSLHYGNIRIIKSCNDYEYIGVTHEFIQCNKPNSITSKLDSIKMLDHANGANRVDKYKRDIDMLHEGLRDKNISIGLKQRYLFYLAQSYRDNNNYDKAIKYYKQRVSLEGWPEEIYYSLYQIGLLYLMKNEYLNALDFLLKAYQYRPTRSESLYQLVKFYRITKQYELAKLFLIKGIKTKRPEQDHLFIDDGVYSYMFELELCLISSYTNDNDYGSKISEVLLHRHNIPKDVKDLVLNNMINYVKPLKEHCKSYKQFEYILTGNEIDEEKKILNPSIIYNNGTYILNTRAVDYELQFKNNRIIFKVKEYPNLIENYISKFDDDQFNSEDDYLKFFDNGIRKFKGRFIVDHSPIKKNQCNFMGYEDIRLVQIKDQLYGIATSIMTNKYGVNHMVLLKIDDKVSCYNIDMTFKLDGKELNPNICQKNWVPFYHDDKLLLIYSNGPTLILECDITTGYCTKYSEGNNSLDFSTYKGSSQVVKIPDGYIYIIHETTCELIENKQQEGYYKRDYYHRFIHMGDDLKIKKISPLFIFNDKPTIEFCAGMCYNGKELVISYGYEDKKCFIAKVDLNEVLELTL